MVNTPIAQDSQESFLVFFLIKNIYFAMNWIAHIEVNYVLFNAISL